MPESKLTPVITVDVNAAVKDSAGSKPITAKIQPPTEKESEKTVQPITQPQTSETEKAVVTAKNKPIKAKAKATVKATPKPKAKAQKITKKAQKDVQTKVPKVPKAKAPKAENGSYLHFGEYSIHVRKESAYAHVYRILGQEVKFEAASQLLDAFDSGEEKACIALLRGVFIDRDTFEKKLRDDDGFIQYCKAKTDRIKEQASRGVAEAKALLKNEKRFKDGVWCGNIREMLSVCCGSTSPEADNRNMKKYANAKISFRQFPRISKGCGKVYLSMFPSKYAPKVNKALKVVFGDEKRTGFADYLETKLKQVFG